jgi:hypothetical protein
LAITSSRPPGNSQHPRSPPFDRAVSVCARLLKYLIRTCCCRYSRSRVERQSRARDVTAVERQAESSRKLPRIRFDPAARDRSPESPYRGDARKKTTATAKFDRATLRPPDLPDCNYPKLSTPPARSSNYPEKHVPRTVFWYFGARRPRVIHRFKIGEAQVRWFAATPLLLRIPVLPSP